MAHSAESVGLAAFSLLWCILDELEAEHPGSKRRILDASKAACHRALAENPDGNASALLEVINKI